MPKRKQPSSPLAEPTRHSTRPCPPRVDVQSSTLSIISTDSEVLDARPSQRQKAIDRINSYELKGRRHENKLKAGLLACINHLPSDGCDSMTRDIINAETDDKLYAVYNNILTALVLPMKTLSSSKSSVTESPHPKRLRNAEIVSSNLDEAQTRKKEFRDLCFERDEHRCVLTGVTSITKWEDAGQPEDVEHGYLEAAHIVPFSYASWRGAPDGVDTIWEVLYRLFPSVRKMGMNVENINSPSNGISLDSAAHTAFGKFLVVFKPTETKNVYTRMIYPRCPSIIKKAMLSENETIKFSPSDDKKEIPIPHQDLLEMHRRLAEILNASGMADTIEKYQQEWEDIDPGSIAPDGTTDVAHALRVALWARVEC